MTKRAKDKRVKSKKADLTCKDATDLIFDYLSRELDSETTAEFEEHLSKCPDCVAFLNTYKKTIQLTKSFLIPRPPELLTAAASSGPVTKHIGAQMIGTLIPNRLQIRV